MTRPRRYAVSWPRYQSSGLLDQARSVMDQRVEMPLRAAVLYGAAEVEATTGEGADLGNDGELSRTDPHHTATPTGVGEVERRIRDPASGLVLLNVYARELMDNTSSVCPTRTIGIPSEDRNATTASRVSES